MKIALCASEAVPFAKTGGLADVAGALPLALERLGQEVIVVLPRYRDISGPRFSLARDKGGFPYATIGRKIRVYFIENDAYFNRACLYGEKTGDYKDNLERFSYYCRRSLELFARVGFQPDVIHVHDWQASLIPVFLQAGYANDPFYRRTRTVLTIHNIGYQGLFAREEFPLLGLDWSYFDMEKLEFYGRINILKGGMVFSDLINTVSPTYSKEIQTKEFGFGLEGVLLRRKDDVYGILNGLDYSIWDPAGDSFIAAPYSLKNIQDKRRNKQNLQRICGLPEEKDVPLCGIVSRLAEQKGFDIFSEALKSILRMNLQLVILGTGDQKYHLLLEKFAKRHPGKFSLHLKFDDSLAHKIYAGSDIFLMPSKYEPCGLGQLISLRYGTIPLVFKTGGLADTITPETGFLFDAYTAPELTGTLKRALAAYRRQGQWRQLIEKAMQCDFSWEESARRYLQLYEKAISKEK